ncbi:MAG: glycoside hydrolase family 31 protein [Clostridia bacterium]|nr:glycoside hydrolase family 31 protein [Clostridia bacterium]
MKKRLISMVLLLTMLLSTFGCALVEVPDEADSLDVKEPNFISSIKSDALSGTGVARPENLLNFGMTDEEGNALFQIVYKLGSTDLVFAECERLANAIFEATGVTVPVVHSMEKQAKYEILVGDVSRAETIDVKDQFDPQKNEVVFKTVDTRLMIFSREEQSLITALSLFVNTIAYQDAEAKEFGVASDFELIQEVDEPTPVMISVADDYYVEILLSQVGNFGILQYTYIRLSYTGNSGWRIQTKLRASDEYNDVGASQRLAASLGEEDPSRLEPITGMRVNDYYMLFGPDGSRVRVHLQEFGLDFYTPNDNLAAKITEIVSTPEEVSISGRIEDDDAIYGTGERFNASNQRGKFIDMFTKDIWCRVDACYMVIPLLTFSRGSGVFVNLYEPMTMDLGKTKSDEWKTVVDGVPLDVYIFTTDEISDVLYGYSELSGYAGMPEEWTYGMIVCTYGPEASRKWSGFITPADDGRGEGVYEIIAKMEEYDLPWTGVLAEPWGGYNYTKYHDELKELCDYVHSLGKKFLVYMSVGNIFDSMVPDERFLNREVGAFDPSYYLYQMKNDGNPSHMLPQTTATTNNPDNGGGSRIYLDITNPDAVKWYFNQYWDYLTNDIGVDGCKIDFCEQLPENHDLLYYDESTPDNGSHHWYPTAFCTMFWDMLSAKPDSGMNYTRGGGIGSQRAPYMWAGDQGRGYASLAWQLTSVLSSGLSGVPFMSYDMSGYQYAGYSTNIAYESQVFIRGTQFTAFTICMQTHGKVRRAYQFADQDSNYLYVTEIYRAYVKLHEHLTPYITELNEEACTTGMPVMRHLILGWQDDKNVRNIEDQYMFGDAFMIAPILNDGYSRNIYLPEGKWLDLNTGEEYTVGKSGQWLNSYTASIAELPTFYNVNTESEIAPALVSGIMDLYDYARSVAP